MVESSAFFPSSGRLPAVLQIDYGPASLLGRFFLWADSAARAKGVVLSFASLEDLVAVNRENRDTWLPLIPIFDPAVGGITARTGFVLLGRNSNGEVVATQAARLYDWPASCFHDEAASLRMFYANPAPAVERGERCEVTAPSAKAITGRVVFSGAGWYRSDYRGRGLSTLLPRISRAYAYTRWRSDYTISMFADAVLAGGMAQRCGYINVEPAAVDLVDSPMGTVRFAFVWMDADEMLSDLDAVLANAAGDEPLGAAAGGRASAQVDGGVDEGSAEQARRA